MNFPIETAAAFPSQTVAALPLPSNVQSSLDPLSVNDPWASAVAVRPVQQQRQTRKCHFGHSFMGLSSGHRLVSHNSGQHHVRHLD